MAQKQDPPAIIAVPLILFSGMVMVAAIAMDGIIKNVAGYFTNARPQDFEAFFRDGLFFDELLAKNLTFRYLATANVFGFEPGLGASKSGPGYQLNSSGALESALRSVGAGKFSSNGGSARLELKLAEFLKQQKNPIAAKKALTPAKRDALTFEARKLLGAPEEGFRAFYAPRNGTSSGVRG